MAVVNVGKDSEKQPEKSWDHGAVRIINYLVPPIENRHKIENSCCICWGGAVLGINSVIG